MAITLTERLFGADAGVLLCLLCRIFAAGGAQWTSFESNFYNGILGNMRVLPREHLVDDLYDKLSRNRCVHLGAPAASGKTSLLQLFQRRFADSEKVVCIYVSMLRDFKAILKRDAGINTDSWDLVRDQHGHCVCEDESKSFVIMLDDAQAQYADSRLWASLVKNDTLPNNIRFIISATYTLVTEGNLADFNALPKIGLNEFLLNQNEVEDFFELNGDREHVGKLLVRPVVRRMIAANCNGHIGALAVSTQEIARHFDRIISVTENDIVSFYLSKQMISCFTRCYNSQLSSLPQVTRNDLVECLTNGWANFKNAESKAYRRLIRSGVLIEIMPGSAKFTSPAAASFINRLIFPNRSHRTTEDVKKRGVFALMKSVVARMSATTLKQSVIDPSTDFPPESTFKALMMSGLEAETPSSCYICSDLSSFFPPSSDQTGGVGAEVKGRCDYFLNGDLRWAIEILICGSELGEHLSRFDTQGKYVGLGYSDYLVVDFRVNATGIPTNVRRHERRMTVFFMQGDFRFCRILCGLDKSDERIELAN